MGFDLWRDVHDIEAGADDWWQRIQEGIAACDTLILCMSLSALKSSIVSDEWYYARKLGRRIIPVIADDIWNHPEVLSKTFTIPGWMQRRNWVDFRVTAPECDLAWANLMKTLNSGYERKKVINMVGELPPRFVHRREETDKVIHSLVDDNNDARHVKVALIGGGGFGKTTLAKAISRDIRVQGVFDDGILWVTLGEELLRKSADDLTDVLIGRIQELIEALTGERHFITSIEMAQTKLKEAIGDRYILMVIDDAWSEAHVKTFMIQTLHSAFLVTSRNADTASDKEIIRYSIERMKSPEAVELLSAGVETDDISSFQNQLSVLARELREYPLLLALVNMQIVNLLNDLSLALNEALDFVEETLKEQGVLGFDDLSANERSRAISMTLDLSIRQLSPEDRQKMYLELAIFPEDELIPLTALEKYWRLNKVATLQFCQLLYRKTALLHSFEGMKIRIHDVFRDYLIRRWNDQGLKALHQRLIASYWQHYGMDWSESDNYGLLRLSYHMRLIEAWDDLLRLFEEESFFKAKLAKIGIQSIIDDAYYSYKALKEKGQDAYIKRLSQIILRYLLKDASLDTGDLTLEQLQSFLNYRSDRGLITQVLEAGLDTPIIRSIVPETADISFIQTLLSTRLANVYRREGQLDKTSEILEKSLEIILQREDTAKERSRAEYDLGYVQYLRGDFQGAVRWLGQSAVSAEEGGHLVGYWMSRCVEARMRFLGGFSSANEFIDVLSEALPNFERLGDSEPHAQRWIKNVHMHLLEAYFAKEDKMAMQKSLDILERDGWVRDFGEGNVLRPYWAMFYILEKDWNKAAGQLRDYLRHLQNSIGKDALRVKEAVSREYYYLGYVLNSKEQRDEALRVWTDALNLPDEPGNHAWKQLIREAM